MIESNICVSREQSVIEMTAHDSTLVHTSHMLDRDILRRTAHQPLDNHSTHCHRFSTVRYGCTWASTFVEGILVAQGSDMQSCCHKMPSLLGEHSDQECRNSCSVGIPSMYRLERLGIVPPHGTAKIRSNCCQKYPTRRDIQCNRCLELCATRILRSEYHPQSIDS